MAVWFQLVGCQAHAFMIFLLALVSIAHSVAISVGKYLTITQFSQQRFLFNKKKVRIFDILGLMIFQLAVV